MHAVGGTFLLLLFLLHLLRVFSGGDYKTRCGSVWVFEDLAAPGDAVGEFHRILPSPFPGGLLGNCNHPLRALSTLPWVGNSLVEFLRGGKELGGVALTRFLSMHIGLAALMALLFFGHDRRPIHARKKSGRDGAVETFGFSAWLCHPPLCRWSPFCLTGLPTPCGKRPIRPPTRNGFPAPGTSFFCRRLFPFSTRAYPLLVLRPFSSGAAPVLRPSLLRPEPGATNLLLRPFCPGRRARPSGDGSVYFTLLGMAGAHYGEKVVLSRTKPHFGIGGSGGAGIRREELRLLPSGFGPGREGGKARIWPWFCERHRSPGLGPAFYRECPALSARDRPCRGMISPWKTWKPWAPTCCPWTRPEGDFKLVDRRHPPGVWAFGEFLGEGDQNEQSEYSRSPNRHSHPGAGGAGLCAALHAADAGKKTKDPAGDQSDHRQRRMFAHGPGRVQRGPEPGRFLPETFYRHPERRAVHQ